MTNGQVDTTPPTPATPPAPGTGAPSSGPTNDQLAAELRGTELALAASVVVTQIRSSFPRFADKGIAEAALTAAPLVLLSPASQGGGLVGILTNPKVVGIAAVAGLAIATDMHTNASHSETASLRILTDNRMDQKVAVGSQFKLQVDAINERGHAVPAENIDFASSKRNVADIDPDGVVTAKEPGIATITASSGGKSDLVTLQVVPAPQEARHQDPRDT